MARYSFPHLSSSVSLCQPRHSPINAMAISSLSEQTGAGPGRLKKGAICSHLSSTPTTTQVQKSSNSGSMSWSSVLKEEGVVTIAYHDRGHVVKYSERAAQRQEVCTLSRVLASFAGADKKTLCLFLLCSLTT